MCSINTIPVLALAASSALRTILNIRFNAGSYKVTFSSAIM